MRIGTNGMGEFFADLYEGICPLHGGTMRVVVSYFSCAALSQCSECSSDKKGRARRRVKNPSEIIHHVPPGGDVGKVVARLKAKSVLRTLVGEERNA